MHNEEKRHFRRYQGQSECEIRSGSETYKGKIVDYSDGIGVVFKDAPQLDTGKQVDIKVFNPKMEFKGQVVWVKNSGDELRAGFRRLDSLQGSLKNFALADILIGLQRSTRTGILKVKSRDAVREVYIKNGDMIYAFSDNKDDGLGEFLLREKKINPEEYDKADKLHKERGEKLGKIFVELGYLTPKEVFLAARHQVEEIIIGLFAIKDGKFIFLELPLPAEELVTFRISAASIIYRGIKRVRDVKHIKQATPKLGAVLEISKSPLNIFQDVVLDELDKEILSYINGRRTLNTILTLSSSNNSDTLRSICALLSIGIIVVRMEDSAPSEVHVEEIIKEPAEEVTSGFIDEVEDLVRKCETLDYYEMLGIEKGASAEEIIEAYYRKSKDYHPDRHFSIASDDLKVKLTKVFSYIEKAYETLSDTEKRAEYDRMLSDNSMELPKELADQFVISEEGQAGEATPESEEEPQFVRPEAMPDVAEAAVAESKHEVAEKEITQETEHDEVAGIAVEQTPDTKIEELKKQEQEPYPDTVKEPLKESVAYIEERKSKSRLYIPAGIATAIVLIFALFFTFRSSEEKQTASAPVVELLPLQDDEEQLLAKSAPGIGEELSGEEEEVGPTVIDTGKQQPLENTDDVQPEEGILPEEEVLAASVDEDSKIKGKQEPSDLNKLFAKKNSDDDKRLIPPAKTTAITEVPVEEEVSEAGTADSDKGFSESVSRIPEDSEEEDSPDIVRIKEPLQKKKRKVPEKTLIAKYEAPEKTAEPRKAVEPVIEPAEEKSVRKERTIVMPESGNFMRYKELFNNNTGKWETYNMTMAAARIENGKYYIENKRRKGEHVILHYADFPFGREFIVATAIKTVKASDNHSYGFVFGASDAGNSYVFQILGDRLYSIKKYQMGVPRELSGGIIGDAVLKNDSFNVLKLEGQGSTIAFYINNHFIAEVSDISFFGKRIGFLVEGKSEIAVDYTRSQVWLD